MIVCRSVRDWIPLRVLTGLPSLNTISAGMERIPAELPLGFGDREIVDAGKAALHETVGGEFPVFVAISAKPLAVDIVEFIFETHSDPVVGEGPQFLTEAVIELASPLSAEELNDGRTAGDKLRAIAPFRILSVGKGDALRISTVPPVLSELNFLTGGFFSEWREGWPSVHG